MENRCPILVKMGLTDCRATAFVIYFTVDINDPIATIRKQRVKFLKEWIKKCKLRRGPIIGAFLCGVNSERVYVYDEFGNPEFGFCMELSRENMKRFEDLLCGIQVAHRKIKAKEKRIRVEKMLASNREMIKQGFNRTDFTLIHGGKER